MAEPNDRIQLGPWPLGVNNKENPRSRVFGVGGQQVRQAINVDFDAEGWVRRRQGQRKVLSTTSAHSLTAVGGRVFFVDANVLYEFFPDSEDILALANVDANPLSFCQAAGRIYFISQTQRGIIRGEQVLPWGVEVPASPVLTETSGVLPAGRFGVALSVEVDGIESGLARPSFIEILSGGIQISTAGIGTDADLINIYLTDLNGKEFFWHSAVAPDESPWAVSSLSSTTGPADGFFVQPPPAGHIVRAYRGYMLVASDNYIYLSQELAPHRFKLSDALPFPERIRLLEPLPDGFYVATASQLFWVGGDEINNMSPVTLSRKLTPEVSPLRVQGSILPKLGYENEVLVWSCAQGFVAGLPGGQIKFLTDNRLVLDPYDKASLALSEREGIRQIILALNEKAGNARFGATDTCEAEVIRAN